MERKSCIIFAERTTLLGGSYEETDLAQCKNFLMSYSEKSVKWVNNYLNKDRQLFSRDKLQRILK